MGASDITIYDLEYSKCFFCKIENAHFAERETYVTFGELTHSQSLRQIMRNYVNKAA